MNLRYTVGDEPPKAASPVVFVHCGELSVGARGKLGLPSPFDMSLGNRFRELTYEAAVAPEQLEAVTAP